MPFFKQVSCIRCVGISTSTVDVINENLFKFSDNLRNTMCSLLTLAQDYSPLSDINFLIQKTGTNIAGLKLNTKNEYWTPIRNVLRIIGKIAQVSNIDDGIIRDIQIDSMNIGCDYFEGYLSFSTDRKINNGRYHWQWTAFPGYERNFDKFKVFPNNWTDLPVKKQSISA